MGGATHTILESMMLAVLMSHWGGSRQGNRTPLVASVRITLVRPLFRVRWRRAQHARCSRRPNQGLSQSH